MHSLMLHMNILITPDASAGRQVRKNIADKKLGFNTKVVTWPELIEEVRLAYVFPPFTDKWSETIRHAISEMPDGFWRKSFDVDPSGATIAMASALDEVISGGGIKGEWIDPSLSERTINTLGDLKRLWDQTGNSFPAEAALIEKVRTSPERTTTKFAIHAIEGWPRLNLQQTNFLTLLGERGEKPDETLLGILREVAVLPDLSETSPAPQKLAHLCFSNQKEEFQSTDQIAFLIARDPLEEIECVVGMTQLLTQEGVEPDKIGFLVPGDQYYEQHLADTLKIIGIPAAGLSEQVPLRDLGGEIVRSLILLARGPLAKMALASLVASPIAPWGDAYGVQMASNVMAGKFELKPPYGMSKDYEKHLAVIRRLRDGKASIVDAIEVFAKNANDPIHVGRLRSLAKQIAEHVIAGTEPDYDRLLELVGHVTATADQPTTFPKNGVRIFHEGQEPWTDVEHLFVLGFNGGRYPSLPSTSPVFHDLEKKAINKHLGWGLPTAEMIQLTRRSRFQRQIAAATGTVKFMASARTISGSLIQPAETATFMAGLLGQEPDDLFIPVHQDDKWLLRAENAFPTTPRQTTPVNLTLDRDLLILRTNDKGEPLPESPSSLETLLVSPLAWLLGRIDAQPDPWSSDTMDVRLQGNIAHGVFERLFTVDGELIEKDAVEDAVDGALTEVIRQQAPLLSTAQWKVERNSLRATLIHAVANWRDVLETLNAKVVGVEARLKGTFSGIPIKGFSDEIVQLPSGKLVVVDFKKSSSGKRRDRMELGYDCQVSLYEKMIADNRSELGFEDSSEAPGIVYYTLNDQRVIADDRTGMPSNVPGLVVISNDVSVNALNEIDGQISKLRKGIVEMNSADDAKRLDKEKALPDYALVSSPLVMMFAHPEQAEDSQ
jgi:ATP-dependent helicase/nuclease subunit B